MTTRATVEVPEIVVVTVGEQGPRGYTGPAGASSADLVVSVQSGELLSVPIGTPVALSAGLAVKASSSGSGKVYGLVYDPSLPGGGFGNVMTGGALNATTSEWDAVTNGSGGLVTGATYYVDAVAGRLTRTPDLSAGVVMAVGYALLPTRMRLFLGSPITL